MSTQYQIILSNSAFQGYSKILHGYYLYKIMRCEIYSNGRELSPCFSLKVFKFYFKQQNVISFAEIIEKTFIRSLFIGELLFFAIYIKAIFKQNKKR